MGLGSQRHIEVQYLWIQEQVRLKRIQVEKVSTHTNPADMLTKHLDEIKRQALMSHMQC